MVANNSINTTSHRNSPNTKKTTPCDVGNLGHGWGQTQRWLCVLLMFDIKSMNIRSNRHSALFRYSLMFIVTRGGDTRSDVYISWFPWRPTIFEMKSHAWDLPDAKWPHMGVKALSKIWNSVKVSSSQFIKYGPEQVLYSWKRL